MSVTPSDFLAITSRMADAVRNPYLRANSEATQQLFYQNQQ
jgi:hypothetical protein